ncbi:3-coathanger stack domain-containing protein [Chryseobacterium gambrini]|uniref:3-coathanger stack domain-containing protein n=1 Tax=Chryseobacterium gambrini TaxID=373672 RepID=UPI003BA60F10
MKIKIYLVLLFISFGINFTSAQHENDNWRFGNNNWKFDNSTPNGFTHTTNINPYIRYASSIISDKNTGELLFYCDGYKIYNKNNQVMTGGDHLFGSPSNTSFSSTGNPSDQSSIIVPDPSSSRKYYVFYINGNRTTNDQSAFGYGVFNYGLRYAIVDMSLGGGLGNVTSSNNILFTNPSTPAVYPFSYDNSTTNALTSTFGNDGNSYWIVTAKDGNILSYKLDALGLNTNPVSSPARYGSFIKISPNSKKLLTRANLITGGGVFLADFNNITGTVTNQMNVIPNNQISNYYDEAFMPNSAEFSPDSNIVYFIISQSILCCGIVKSGLAMYNISTGVLRGYNNNMYPTEYEYPLQFNGATGSLQRATNGKIYMIQNQKLKASQQEPQYNPVLFETTINNTTYSYNWLVINTPNIWNPTINPLSSITPPVNTRNGFSFPQLIPSLDNVNTCPDIRNITQPVTASENFQAGQSIIASSAISNDLFVNYKAGQNVTLLPGFYVKATTKSLFRAYIGPCDEIIENFAKTNNVFTDSKKKDISKNALASDVKIYPNPSSTFIKIDSGNEEVVFWELFDISGKSILKGNSIQLNVQGLPKANYVLKINTKNKQVTKKVIVN